MHHAEERALWRRSAGEFAASAEPQGRLHEVSACKSLSLGAHLEEKLGTIGM